MQVTPQTPAIAPRTLVAERYRLGPLLGRGGMAEVYDGIDERLERAVAVKLLRPEMAARDDIRSRFQAEARAAAGLAHPNAVAVFDTGTHLGVPFLVMERLPGETLADRLAAGPVDPSWMRITAVGVLGALEAAHAAGIVHRDVKPGNILLTREGTAKITDFGIAKSIHPADEVADPGRVDLTASGQILGTPAYLAPERLEGHLATPRSDLWAFGVVLYEALAGVKPFEARSPLAVAHAIVTGAHVPLGERRPDLNPDLVATVERAMARDPEDRFATAGEMADALRDPAAVTGGAATALDEPVGDGTMVLPAILAVGTGPRRARPRLPLVWRRRLVWIAIAAVVVLLLVVLARSGRSSSTASTGAPPTTAAPARGQAQATPTTTPTQGLAQRLDDLAGRLNAANDGPRAPDLATWLRRVATDLRSGSPAAAGDATGAIVSAGAWNQTGQLSAGATTSAVELLSQVPGVQTAGTTPATTGAAASSAGSSAVVTPPTAAPAPAHGDTPKPKGKAGKG